MSETITDLLAQGGYFGVALLMFLENLFPPIPSELVMPLTGFVARQGRLTFWGVVLAGTVGACIGQLPFYYLGRSIGTDRLKVLLDRHPWLGVTPAELDCANAWFTRHGGKAVFFCRLIPAARTYISIPAGLSRMPLGRFFLYTVSGTAIWTTALAWAGWLLGNAHTEVEKYLAPASTVVFALAAIAYAVRLIRRLRRKRSEAF